MALGAPSEALLAALDCQDDVAVLESSAYHDDFGRYSVFACQPIEVLTLHEGTLRDRAGNVLAEAHGPSDALWASLEAAFEAVRISAGADTSPERARRVGDGESCLSATAANTAAVPPALPPAYVPGWIGYVGYEVGRYVERLPGRAARDTALPDLRLAFYDALLVFDAQEHAWTLVELEFDGESPAGAGQSACVLAQLAAQTAAVVSQRPQPAEHADAAHRPAVAGRPNFQPQAYQQAVQRCIDYIAAGDIFQVNLSQRLEIEQPPAPMDLYRVLRRRNPAWYAAYLAFETTDARCHGQAAFARPCGAAGRGNAECGMRNVESLVQTPWAARVSDEPGAEATGRKNAECGVRNARCAIVSSSPELFLRVRGRSVLTRPIKGTRPRVGDQAADAASRQELWDSPKDNAELAMIIDLLRNDLGRVCRMGSVRVIEPRRLETHPTVYHLVGTVSGELADGVGPAALLRATFPGGSITGAPKIRAMEIIDELEPTARGVYCGCVGMVGVDGRSEWNIAIRTIVCDGGRALVQVGGGIVADSSPRGEYDETLDKARAMLEAVHEAVTSQ